MWTDCALYPLPRVSYDKSMNTELPDLQNLPIAQKLVLVEQLWDGIGSSEESLVLQDWHRDEATRRAAELDADPSVAISREELWRRVERTDG